MMHAIGAAFALGLAAQVGGIVPEPVPEAQIPEIIVTARRTEEPLSELPVSATVFDSRLLEQGNFTSLDELARFTPGFSFDSAAGRGPNSNRPTIRGLTTIRNGIANSTVAATFIDGVYLGGSTQSTELYDLERVEILRGPQSAQFGRATYAGAINYVTRPASAEFTAGAGATAAEHDTARAHGWISGPISAGVRAYFGVGYDRYGGEYTNTRDGSTVGGQEARDATLKIEAQPTEQLALTLRFGLQETDDDHYAMWLQPRTVNNCCFRTAEAPRAREYYVGESLVGDAVTLYTDALEKAGGAGFELQRELGSLSLRWTPGRITVSSLTGLVNDDLKRGFDASYAAYDPVPTQPGSFLQRDELEQADFSQEFRIASAADQRLRWMAGLYYYRGSLDEVVENRVVVNPDDSISVLPNFGDLTLNDIENHAVFGSLEYELPRDFTAGLELRYAADDVRVTSTPNIGSTIERASYQKTFYSVSPRFTLSWQATENLMPYVNVARGQSPGTFNATVPDESYRDVEEEVLWSYELGLRGTIADNRARFALALYHLDVHDQQFTTIVELDNGTTASVLDNVGRSSVTGAEVETSALLGDNLTASFSYAWTDAKIRRQISEEQADLMGSNGSIEDLQRLGDVSGHRTPRVPEHMAALMLEYRRPWLADASWFAGGDWSFESSRYAQEDNLIETGDRVLLGLHAGLEWRHTQLRLWVSNVTDDDTPIDVQRYIDGHAPRLPTCQSFVTAGTAPPGTVCTRSSSTPRGFAISLPRGRQAGITLDYRF